MEPTQPQIASSLRAAARRALVSFVLFAVIPSALGAAAVVRFENATGTLQVDTPERDVHAAPPMAAEPIAVATPPPTPDDRPAAAPDRAPDPCATVDSLLAATSDQRRAAAVASAPITTRLHLLDRLVVRVAPEPGYVLSYGGPLATIVDGYRTAWQHTSDGSLAGFAVELHPSIDAALAADAGAIRSRCGDVTGTFVVDGIDGSVGVAMDEPDGGVTHQVSFVRDARRYVVALRQTGDAPYERIATLASLQAALP